MTAREPGATTTTRNRGSGTNKIAYQLHRDPGKGSSWGNPSGTDTQSGTGSGTAQNFPIYGRVAAQTAPGIYSDVVTVTY